LETNEKWKQDLRVKIDGRLLHYSLFTVSVQYFPFMIMVRLRRRKIVFQLFTRYVTFDMFPMLSLL
jgi:hypothetical protein